MAAAAGLGERTTHWLRHTRLTVANDTADLRAVQSLALAAIAVGVGLGSTIFKAPVDAGAPNEVEHALDELAGEDPPDRQSSLLRA
ncbi:MAG: hypothetical protein ACFCVC_04060 [Acidimicrobiia bacterium]